MAPDHQTDRPDEALATPATPSAAAASPPSPISPTAPQVQTEQPAAGVPSQTLPRPPAAQQSGATPLPAPYNRHQHPIQAFPGQGVPGGPSNRLLSRSRSWAYARLALYLITFIAALVVFSITCSLLANSLMNTQFLSLVDLPISIGALAWTLAELITFTVRNGGLKIGRDFKDGVHPGAHVGMNLVLWMAWTLPVVITALRIEQIESIPYKCRRPSAPNSYNYCSGSSDAILLANWDRVLNSELPRLKALRVFCIIALVLQFALFVGACIDTDKRNKAKRTVIYVQAPMPMMMPPYGGWPQQPQQYPPPGMGYTMAPMHHQQPYGPPHPGFFPSHHPQQQQQQQHHHLGGEKSSAANSSPMMTGYYAPATPAAAARPPQPVQTQIPTGGYYAPSGPSGSH